MITRRWFERIGTFAHIPDVSAKALAPTAITTGRVMPPIYPQRGAAVEDVPCVSAWHSSPSLVNLHAWRPVRRVTWINVSRRLGGRPQRTARYTLVAPLEAGGDFDPAAELDFRDFDLRPGQRASRAEGSTTRQRLWQLDFNAGNSGDSWRAGGAQAVGCRISCRRAT